MVSVSSSDHLLSQFQQGRYHDIISDADNNVISVDSNPLAAKVVAAAYFQIGDFIKASNLLEFLEAACSDDSDYLSLYGATCRRLGQLTKAQDLLGRALKVSNGSLEIYNNYANLLVDLGKFKEAETILVDVLKKMPDYSDAQKNLNRVQFLLSSTTQPPADIAPSNSTAVKTSPLQDFQDPLTLAFSDEEVSLARGKYSTSDKQASLVDKLPNPRSEDLSTEQLSLAYKAIREDNPTFALNLCDKAYLSLACNGNLYNCVADALIKMEHFSDAEVNLLHSMTIDEPNVNQLINLVALTSLRGDITLAEFYLEKAASLDPSHPHIPTVRANLAQRRQNSLTTNYSFSRD